MKRIRLSFVCFGSSIISAVVLSPFFGNFTAERLPVVLVVTTILGLAWGFVAGTLFKIP